MPPAGIAAAFGLALLSHGRISFPHPSRYPGGVVYAVGTAFYRRVPLPRGAAGPAAEPGPARALGGRRRGPHLCRRHPCQLGRPRPAGPAGRSRHRSRGWPAGAHDGRHRGGLHGSCRHSLRDVHDHGLPRACRGWPNPVPRPAAPPTRAPGSSRRAATGAAPMRVAGADAAARSVLPEPTSPRAGPPARRAAHQKGSTSTSPSASRSARTATSWSWPAGRPAGRRNRIAELLEAAAARAGPAHRPPRGAAVAGDAAPRS